MSEIIQTVLVDDHKIMIEGLEALLCRHEKFKISKNFDGESFLEREDLLDVELLILDVNMKGIDGIQTFKLAKEKGFDGKCIFLSSYDDLKLVNEAINLGAHGYVTKGCAAEYLEDAIEAVLKNEIYYSPDLKERILNAFSKGAASNKVEDSKEEGLVRQLTERETEVLKLIALQYTSDEISKKLYIAKSTVDTHRKNLIYKLKVKNAVGLGLFAKRHGMI